tara:strand:- start:1044 stop:1277 length:234 start_codon:yes stop_codon:yes gene_type:complete
MRFQIGDLVTVDSETLRGYVQDHTYNRWSTNKLGIVTQIEGHYVEGESATTILVQVHFESLGNSYWLYAREVILLTP